MTEQTETDISGDHPQESPTSSAHQAHYTRQQAGGGLMKKGSQPKPAPPSSTGLRPAASSSQKPPKNGQQPQGENIFQHMLGHVPDELNPLAPFLKRAAGVKDDPSAWEDLQYWGRAMNAFIDPNAISKSMHNIYADKSVGGSIKQAVADTVLGPLGALGNAAGLVGQGQNVREKVAPQVLAAGASWDPSTGIPMMAAALPSDPGKITGEEFPVGEMASEVGHDPGAVLHPDFLWKAAGTLLHGAMLIGLAVPALRSLKAVPGLSKLADHIESFANPERVPKPVITLPDGRIIDPQRDPQQYQKYAWIQKIEQSVPAIEEAKSKLKPELKEDPRVGKPKAEVIKDPATGALSVKITTEQAATRAEQGKVARQLGLTYKKSPFDQAEEFKGKVAAGLISPAQADWVEKNWNLVQRALRFQAPLQHWHPSEPALGNPYEQLGALKGDQKVAGAKLLTSLNTALGHVVSGIYANHDNPLQSMFRAMVGGGDNARDLANSYVSNVLDILPAAEDRDAVRKAIEDWSGEAVKALSPAQRMVYDAHRQLYGAIGDRSVAYGRFEGRRPFYFPRVQVRPPVQLPPDIATGVNVTRLMGKPARHRAETLGIRGGEIVKEQMHKTVESANQAVRDARKRLAEAIAKDHPKMGDATIKKLVEEHVPLFSTDYAAALHADLSRSMQNTHLHQVMDILSNSTVKMDGLHLPAAFKRGTVNPFLDKALGQFTNEEKLRHLTSRGYKQLEGPGLRDYYVHPGFADPWNRLVQAGAAAGGESFLREVTKWSMRSIMLNPLWHAMNMLGRATSLFFASPVETTRQLLKAGGVGGNLDPQMMEGIWRDARSRYISHGGVVHAGSGGPLQEYAKNWMQATGDMSAGEAPGDLQADPKGIFDKPGIAQAVKGLGWAGKQYTHLNDWFWSKYDDFGTMAFLIEERNALQAGLHPTQAAMYAASRANAWKGSVSASQWSQSSPLVRDASRLLLFAPNWWRSYGQLLTGSVDRTGLSPSREISQLWVKNQMRTLFGMWMANFATGNALNYMLSGHFQWENSPNDKTKLELDNFAPVNPSTGAHTVIENPLVRQQTDLWHFLGLTAPPEDYVIDQLLGKPPPEPANPNQQATTAWARTSPLVDAIATAMNTDVYGSLQARNWRYVDPSNLANTPSPLSLLTAATAFTPLGFATQYAAQQSLYPQKQGQPQQMPALPGATGALDMAPIPKGVKEALSIDTADQQWQSLGALLGVRGPYGNTQRSVDPGLSTADRLQVTQFLQGYESKLLQSEHDTISGGKTMGEWFTAYQVAAAAKGQYLNAKYDHTTEYQGGAAGVLAQWEGIYSEPGVTLENGEINHVKLEQRQAEIKNQVLSQPNGQAIWDQFQVELHKNDMAHPVLRVWHDVEGQYHTFQDDYARQHGLSGAQLRDDLGAYYQAGPSLQRQQFATQHPQLRQFFAAKKQWERTTAAGLTYGLFTNSSYVADFIHEMGPAGEAKFLERDISQEG